MPGLNISRSYANGSVLLETDLDYIKDGIETFVNTTLIDDDNLAANTISTAKLLDNSLATAKIADEAVTAAKIDDGAITTAKINDAAVTGDDIAALAVTTDKLTDEAVTAAKIADGAVTAAKLAACNIVVSNSSSTFSSSSSSNTAVTNLSAEITTSGRPVWVQLQSDGSSNPAYIGCPVSLANGTNLNANVDFIRTTSGSPTTLQSWGLRHATDADAGIQIPSSAFFLLDEPAAGTHTYTVKVGWTSNPSTSLRVYYTKLVVYEL